MDENAKRILYLAACALHGRQADVQRLKGCSPAELFQFAQFHLLTGITGAALGEQPCEAADEQERAIAAQWQEARSRVIRKNMLLAAETDELCRALDASGIWYLPLKGIMLEKLYPGVGMRQMSDVDMLYDAQCQDAVKALMLERGYEAVSVGNGHHDVYQKPPVYEYELHTALFTEDHNVRFAEYYRDVKARLLPDGQGGCGQRLCDEDFYLYTLCHAYKHYSNAGIGLRTLLDNYIFQWRKADGLRREYLEREAEKLGLGDYVRVTESLSRKLFSEEWLDALPDGAELPDTVWGLSERERAMLEYMIGSGAGGTVRNRVNNQLYQMNPDGATAWTKVKYAVKRTLPGWEFYKKYSPVCKRHPWTIPFCAVYRIGHALAARSDFVFSEVRELFRSNQE